MDAITESYRYARTADGYRAYRKSDGKLLGSIHRVETLAPRTPSATGRRTGASRTTTYTSFGAMAPGETTERAHTDKRERAARHLDALDRARTAVYRKGDKIRCDFPDGHIGSGVEIERVDGEHLYIVGHAKPITRAAIRVWTSEEPLPRYKA